MMKYQSAPFTESELSIIIWQKIVVVGACHYYIATKVGFSTETE